MNVPRSLRSIFVRVLFIVVGAAAAAITLSTSVAATLVSDDKQGVVVEDAMTRAGRAREELGQRIAIARAELRSVALASANGMIAEVPALVSGNVIALRCVRGGEELVEAAADREAHDALAALPLEGPPVELLSPDRLLIRMETAGSLVIAVLDVASVRDVPPGWTLELTPEDRAGPDGEGWLDATRGGAVVARVIDLDDGHDVLRAVARGEGEEPSVVLSAPLAPARRAASALTRSVFFFSALVLLPVIGLAWLLARAVTRPVRLLATAARRAGAGPIVLPPLPKDEIGDLGSAIETMSAQLFADAEGLRAAVDFARRSGRMLEKREILLALEAALRKVAPEARWRVLPRSELTSATDLPAPGRTLERQLDVLESQSEMRDGELHHADDSRELPLYKQLARADGVLVIAVYGASTHAVVIGQGVHAMREEKIAQLLAGVASSALRRAEMTLEAASNEQLAALGRLAAGVTHEINNALALVLTNVKMLEDDLDGELRSVAQDARSGADRVARITNDLASLSRGGVQIEARPGELGPLVAASVKQAQARRAGVTIEVEPFDETMVRCDAGRIEQALVNLLANASDAASSAGRPYVRVTVRRERSLAVVEIQDRGKGIPSGVEAQIFEPFYTTKGAKGSGLGLFISRALARAHGGDIRVVSTSREGTTFALSIPIARITLATVHV